MQHAQRVLAMVACHPGEFVKDPLALPATCCAVTLPNYRFNSRRVAMLSCLAIFSSTPQLRWWVAVYMRQQPPTR